MRLATPGAASTPPVIAGIALISSLRPWDEAAMAESVNINAQVLRMERIFRLVELLIKYSVDGKRLADEPVGKI